MQQIKCSSVFNAKTTHACKDAWWGTNLIKFFSLSLNYDDYVTYG